MSHSRRRHPFNAWSYAESDKIWKRMVARRFRRRTKICLLSGREPPISSMEIVEQYSCMKDGKQRFDPEEWPEGMRK